MGTRLNAPFPLSLYRMKQVRILITGAGGQIGQVLGGALEEKYGADSVLATDLKPVDSFSNFSPLDVLDLDAYKRLMDQFQPTMIYHLAGILSAVGERNPGLAWNVNTRGWINTLELVLSYKVERVFFPSSIAVFGPGSPLEQTGQNVPLHPSTVYGITKVAGENLAQYYYRKYGLDVRGLRYPGIISYQTAPGGGTTDYAVDIFHQIIETGIYTCFLGPDRVLPMMYIDDAVRGTLQLMEANRDDINVRTAYNFGAMSFSPAQLIGEIKKYVPEARMECEPDFRDDIAKNWPEKIIDKEARQDWKWKPQYNLQKTVEEMINQLRDKNLIE